MASVYIGLRWVEVGHGGLDGRSFAETTASALAPAPVVANYLRPLTRAARAMLALVQP